MLSKRKNNNSGIYKMFIFIRKYKIFKSSVESNTFAYLFLAEQKNKKN